MAEGSQEEGIIPAGALDFTSGRRAIWVMYRDNFRGRSGRSSMIRPHLGWRAHHLSLVQVIGDFGPP